MAEVRCPMCGKLNPEGSDVCQFCQARLTPLHISPSEAKARAASQPPGGEKASEDESVPEWLRSLRLEEETSEELEEPEAGGEESDWLKSQEDESLPEQPAEEGGELPDWLTDLRQQGKGGIEEASPQDQEEEEAESSWEEADGEEKDWLADIRNEGEASPSLEESEQETPDLADEEPDWLQRIRSRSQDEAESPATEEQEEVEPASTWPESLRTQEAEAGPEEEAATAVEPDEIPDWLSEISNEQDVEPPTSEEGWPTEEQQPAEEAPPEASTPEDLPSAAPFDTGTLRDLYSEESESEAPAWMARFSGETGGGSKAAEEETPAGEEESTEKPAVEAASEEAETQGLEEESAGADFDWLTDIQQAALQEQPAEEKPLLFTSSGAISPFTLEEEGGEPEEAQAADEAGGISDASPESAPPAVPAQIPDWLAEVAPRESGVGPSDETEEPEANEPAGRGEIAPAELPSWLEAMRPVEFAASKPPPVEEGADRVESVGPLAGLRGVLPAEPDVSRAGKPGGYSLKLQVSDAQQTHASLLETLIKGESKARPLPQRAAISPQHVLRLAIAVVLIIAAVFPMLMGWPQVSLPAFPPEVGAVNYYINQLKAGAPVLVAVDYEPGWSGEMDATAAGVIQHLQLMGAYPALISTVPTGPAQAEHLLAVTEQGPGVTWQAGTNYANLGFIPGGATGLLSFAQSPQKVVPAYTETGKSAWDEGSLARVQSISDFALAIVITQNPDTARTWIEQVGPYLGKQTPLLMLLSAQAEPLVRPYYEEFQQQVSGMVVGLVGGASYENLNGRPLLAKTYWDAFNLVVPVAVVIIFLGALINASLAAAGKRKTETRHEGTQ